MSRITMNNLSGVAALSAEQMQRTVGGARICVRWVRIGHLRFCTRWVNLHLPLVTQIRKPIPDPGPLAGVGGLTVRA